MTTVLVSEGAVKVTAGLLGVEVPDWVLKNGLDAAASGMVRDMRLEEAERRILALEALVQKLGEQAA